MLCKNCGAEIPDGTMKCEYCGAVLETEKSAANDNQRVFDENEQKRREQVDKMMAEKQKQLSEIERRRTEKRQKQKRQRIAAISAICAGVVAAGGIGGYYVHRGINENESALIVTPTPAASLPVVMPTIIPAALQSPEPSQVPDTTSDDNSSENVNWTATGGSSNSSGSSSSGGSSGGSGSSNGSGNSSSGGSSGNGSSNGSGSSSGSGSSGGGSSNGSTNSSSGGSSSSSASNSGSSGVSANGNISAALAKGGEVINNNGKHLMSFNINGRTYYANVSPDSTTEQINGQDMTVTAVPTSDKYNGSTVYEINSLTYYNGKDYILPNSGTKLVTNADIEGFSKDKLALARNEIYARHGRKFQMQEFKDYFEKQPWYKTNPNYNYEDDDSNLNSIESRNVTFLLNAENSR